MSEMRATLATLGAGSRAVIAVLPADGGLADELAALRVLPGEGVEIVQVLPLGGPVLIRTRGGLYALGRRLASQIAVDT